MISCSHTTTAAIDRRLLTNNPISLFAGWLPQKLGQVCDRGINTVHKAQERRREAHRFTVQLNSQFVCLYVCVSADEGVSERESDKRKEVLFFLYKTQMWSQTNTLLRGCQYQWSMIGESNIQSNMLCLFLISSWAKTHTTGYRKAVIWYIEATTFLCNMGS